MDTTEINSIDRYIWTRNSIEQLNTVIENKACIACLELSDKLNILMCSQTKFTYENKNINIEKYPFLKEQQYIEMMEQLMGIYKILESSKNFNRAIIETIDNKSNK